MADVKVSDLVAATALADADLLMMTQNATGDSKKITVANASATEAKKGFAEIASSAEAAAGTDNSRIITPAKAAALMPYNWIGGLHTRLIGDVAHDVTIEPGGCIDDGNALEMRLASSIEKQIDVAWAEDSDGSPSGGMDTGAVAANSVYYIWLIKNPTSGKVDALFSLSETAPTLPAGFTLKRLIMAVVTDASADIIRYFQMDTRVEFTFGHVVYELNTLRSSGTYYTTSPGTGLLRCPKYVVGDFRLMGNNPITTVVSEAGIVCHASGGHQLNFTSPLYSHRTSAATTSYGGVQAGGTLSNTGASCRALVGQTGEVVYALDTGGTVYYPTIVIVGMDIMFRNNPSIIGLV